LCLNGHECAKRQLAREGIAYQALDNGVLSCPVPQRLQQICDELSAEKIDGLLRKWLHRLPHPFTAADQHAGYRYDISILQAEFSLTQVLDRPVHGRLFFEQVIRENLVGMRFDQRQRRQALGMARSAGRHRADDQAVAVLHQRVAHETEPRLFAWSFAEETGVGVGGRGGQSCRIYRPARICGRLRIFGQQDKLRANRSKGRETWA
jgi:hypothetical protein